MDILVVAQRVPFPPNKGEKIRTYHQIKWLHEQGHQITLACPISDPSERANLADLERQLGLTALSAQLPNKFLRLFRGFLRGISLSEANFHTSTLASIINMLGQKQSFDAILLSASSLLPYADSLPYPLLMDFMDLDSDKWAQYASRATWPMRWVYARESKKIAELERVAAQRAHACFFISNDEIALFKQRVSSQNICQMGNGIDTESFYPISSGLRKNCSKDPVFLFVGTMDYAPNIDAMLWFAETAWPKISQLYPLARLIIAGMNPNHAVQALARKPGIQVTGFVEEILPYFHQADIFIAPFRIARGVQNKVLQAFACGLPTVSTQMGVEGINCQPGEHYMQAETGEAFVSAITDLVKCSDKRFHLSHHSSLLIREHYSWHAQLATLGEQLEALKS